MARYDLHSHSTHSDGLLTPTALVGRAAGRGVAVLALTDHDEVGGLAEAKVASAAARISLVAGCEVSVTWAGTTIHIVGLHVDPADPALNAGLGAIRAGRATRARRIANALAQAGIPGAFEGACRYATSERLVTRTHFARFLVHSGRARDVRDVFARYLTRGNPGYVPHAWAGLGEAIGWIRGAGGQAILAHPGRYKLARSSMLRLLAEFRDAGGAAIEVLSSSHTAGQYTEFAAHARVFGLRASSGADYHGPGESRVDLGDLPDLPAGVVPVWKDW